VRRIHLLQPNLNSYGVVLLYYLAACACGISLVPPYKPFIYENDIARRQDGLYSSQLDNTPTNGYSNCLRTVRGVQFLHNVFDMNLNGFLRNK
jgi:hypothetical protein